MEFAYNIEEAKIITARAAGIQHELVGLPCQDYVKSAVFAVDDPEESDAFQPYLVMLADGAGSVEHSERISSDVCEYLAQLFLSCDQESWLNTKDEELRSFILENTEKRLAAGGLHADCTFLAFAENAESSVLIHTGDGVIIGVGEEARVLSRPENGNEPNLTYFLSGSQPEKHIRIIRDIPENIDTIIMTSDGAAGLLWNAVNGKPSQAAQIMADWIRTGNPEEVKEKLTETIENLFKSHSTDDISIALIRRGRIMAEEEDEDEAPDWYYSEDDEPDEDEYLNPDDSEEETDWEDDLEDDPEDDDYFQREEVDEDTDTEFI